MGEITNGQSLSIINSDYHKDESPVAGKQADVASKYLKQAARVDELNGHPPGSDGPMVTALKKYNGGQVLVFVMGAFAEMSEDVSRIRDIIAHELARTHVSYHNDDAKRIKGMYRQRIQKAWGHTAHRVWARLLLDRARDLIIHGPKRRYRAAVAVRRRASRTWTRPPQRAQSRRLRRPRLSFRAREAA